MFRGVAGEAIHRELSFAFQSFSRPRGAFNGAACSDPCGPFPPFTVPLAGRLMQPRKRDISMTSNSGNLLPDPSASPRAPQHRHRGAGRHRLISDDAVIELLADLRHFCAARRIDFAPSIRARKLNSPPKKRKFETAYHDCGKIRCNIEHRIEHDSCWPRGGLLRAAAVRERLSGNC